MFPRILALSGLILLLSACASLPDDVAVEQPDALPEFSAVLSDPERYTGLEVVFGGNIVDVTNHADSTTIEMLQLPLYSSGRPRDEVSRSGGRFRVTFDTFLDPEIFTKGRQLTIRGNLMGTEDGKIGSHPYSFPSVSGTGLYLWREQLDKVEVHYVMGINSFAPYGYPFHDRRLTRPAVRKATKSD